MMGKRVGIVVLLALLGLLSVVAKGSGVSTHLIVVSRSHSFLPKSVQQLYSSLHSGAFFPDSFYNCLGLSDVAEDTHWPPFLLEASKYYREKYGLKSSQLFDRKQDADLAAEEGAKLKAFLFGIFTHQIADSTWHSLRMNDGLLKHLAAMEFSGNIEQAHAYLDTAVDYLLLKKLSEVDRLDKDNNIESYFGIKWETPVDDLINIYKRLGHRQVNNNNLMYCLRRGNIGLKLELNSYELTWPAIISDSPYCDDIFDSYFLGGLDEIETTIAKCIKNLLNWLDNDDLDLDNLDSWDLCPEKIVKPGKFVENKGKDFNPVQRPKPENRTEVLRKKIKVSNNSAKTFISPFVQNSRFGHDITLGKFLGENQELYAAISAPLENTDGSVYLIPLEEISCFSDDSINLTSIRGSGNSNNVAQRYGYALENFVYTFSLDGNNVKKFEFLVISVPGEERIHIFSGLKRILLIDFPKQYKQIGINLMCADINEDGIFDLVISTPFSNSSKRTGSQNGVVLIFDGKEILKKIFATYGTWISTKVENNFLNNFMLQMLLDQHSLISDVVYFQDLNPTILESPQSFILDTDNKESKRKGFQNFGTSICSNDKYLFVSMRSTGTVFIYRSIELMKNGRGNAEPAYCLTHKEDSSNGNGRHKRVKSLQTGQFGSRLMISGNELGMYWLAVGAHSETYESCVLCGGIYLYVFEDKLKIEPKLISKIIIKKSSEFSKFGYAGTLVNNEGSSMLYISAPTFKQNTGAIFLVNVTQILVEYLSKGVFTTTAIDEPMFLGPSETYSGFGNTISSFTDADGKQKLLVGAPSYGYSELFSNSKKLTGLAIIYDL